MPADRPALHDSLRSDELVSWQWDAATDSYQVDASLASMLKIPSRGRLQDAAGIGQPAERAAWIRASQHCLLTGDVLRVDLQLTLASGTQWLEVHGQRTWQGATPCLLGYVRCLRQHQPAASQVSPLTRPQLESVFLAKMSHEIRTPLLGVLGMAELLRDSSLSGDQLHNVDLILSSGRGLLNLLNDILDLSKAEAGKLQLEARPFTLDAVLSEVFALMAPRAFEKDLVLASLIAPELPERLVGDELRLRQVLQNLMSNAVKFTAKGTVTLVARLAHEEDKELLEFVVEDTGEGMSEQTVGRLFTPFMQADAATSRRHGGTGLGLLICKQLVEAMGGQLSATSTLNQGSRFAFTVRMPAWQPIAPYCETDGRPLRLLVADPDESVSFDCGLLLQKERVTCDWAALGADALERLVQAAERSEPYTWTLVNEQLTDMDASVFAAQVRKRLPSPPPLVLMTSNPLRTDDAAARASGFAGLVHKPLTRSTLQQAFADSKSPAVPATSVATKHPAVLVVDDNAVNRTVLCGHLKKLGYAPVAVEGGQQALDALRNDSFAAIFMDCDMPGINGYEATRRLRAQGSTLPVIAFTAGAFKEDLDACRAAGMNDLLIKPCTRDAVASVLRRWGEAGWKVTP